MRCVPVLMTALTAALLLGAMPASADDIVPSRGQAEKAATAPAKTAIKKQVAKPASPKPASPKPEPPKTAAIAPAIKLPTPKPEAAKADERKPSAPVAAKPVETKASDSKPNKAKPDTITGTTPDVFAGISQGDRLKIQSALLWSGDYPSAANGEDPMLTAIKNFQKRIKANVTGTLTGSERTALVAAARDYEQEYGWSVVLDPATGIRIGLPAKMVPNAQEAARGTRWSSAQGQVQVETFRIVGANLKLSDQFEQEKKEPANRKVEYSLLRDDSFIVSGLQGLKKFTVRAYIRNGEIRGFTMLFDQMMETIVTPVMVSMASAFTPFPERSAPFAALTKSVEYGNGLMVSAQGHIITDRKLTEGCQVLVASGIGDAVRIAVDKDSGLALLRVYGPRKVSPMALPVDAPKSGELTLVGIPDPKEQNGARKLTEIKARLIDGSAIELRQPVPMAGFSGAAALDAQGRVVGMTEMRNAVLASVEPAAPPVRLINAMTIRAFLDANNVPLSAEVSDAKAGVVRMICVRK